MANLSSCDPEVLSEVPYSDSYPNNMINQDVQEMYYSKQTHIDNFQDNEIHSDSNIIPYSQYLQESQDASKEKESKYIDKEIVLEKQNKELENITSLGYQNPFHLKKAQRIQLTLYDGGVIAKEHAMISVIDDEETLILEEERRSKMLDKQNDPISIKEKIKISPIDYSKLNMIKEDFGKRFVTQKELSKEQAFWLKLSSLSETPVKSHTPVRIEAPSELSKSCANDCSKCLELETELLKKKDFIEKEAYDKLVKSYSILEKHCISLELTTQLKQEIFQRENSGENLNAPTFNQFFKINKLKAQSQKKDTVIRKLKDRIKSLNGKDSLENVKKVYHV
ncbi:hypothetical protein Tco_0120999 [Tanacetum coccineum]